MSSIWRNFCYASYFTTTKTILITTILSFIVCFQFTASHAQEYQLIRKIDTLAKVSRIDNLGNLFLVTPKNEVMKFSPQGKFLWNYTNNKYGDITQLDVTDPLRVVLYYQAHQQIVVLNNNLSEISRFSFEDNPDQQITLVSSANNNGFWIYDQINRELKKLSNSFIDELKTGNIYQRDGFDMQANYMLSTDQYIFVNDVSQGIRIFDRFGNFYKTAVIGVVKEFEVEGEHIFFYKDSQLLAYNFVTFNVNKIPLPQSVIPKEAVIQAKHLVILNEKGLTLWALKGK